MMKHLFYLACTLFVANLMAEQQIITAAGPVSVSDFQGRASVEEQWTPNDYFSVAGIVVQTCADYYYSKSTNLELSDKLHAAALLNLRVHITAMHDTSRMTDATKVACLLSVDFEGVSGQLQIVP